MGTFFIDKEQLALEEQEAKERGISIFQLRHFKKMSEDKRNEIRKKREKAKKERLKKEQLQKEQIKRKKEKEKIKKFKEKELQKQKIKEKKEKEKLKKEQWLLEHPGEKPKKKRPVGRPKKRGPKKKYRRKKKIIVEKKQKHWNYKIISCKNGKQDGFIGVYLTIDKAYEKLKELTETNTDIVFPSLITHSEYGNSLSDSKYEYLLLERKFDDTIPKLRNEFGKLVEQRSNSENWNIIDKRKYQVEETFWVWGFNNKTERKTFPWIYENILIGGLSNSYDIKRVLLYKNKVIIKNDDDTMDLIFCKTKSDAFRFYQLLEEKVKQAKNRQIFFVGSYDVISDKRRKLEEELMEMTGWTKKKIQMPSTSEHKKLDFYQL